MPSTAIDPTQTQAADPQYVLRESPPSPAEWDEIRGFMVPEFQFLTSNWAEPWNEHLVDSSGWIGPVEYFVTHNEAGHTVAAVPFATHTKARFRFRSLAGLYVPLRGLPIAQNAIDKTVNQLADFLTERHDGIGLHLAPIPVLDPAIAPLMKALRQRGWRTHSTHVGYRQIISLPDTFDAFETERKGSRWKTIRKRERKAEREHDYRVSLFTTEDCEDWRPVIRDLGEIERLSWLPDEQGDMWFVADAQIRFWTDVFNAQRQGLAARIWIMYFDDKPVAFDFNLDSGGCRYSVAGHYIKEVHPYGTGSILMKHMVRNAIERGVRKIDMGTGNTGYKTFWGATMADQIVDWTAYPPGVRGTVMFVAANLLRASRSAKTGLQRLAAKLPTRKQNTQG